jgi:hypothetical protein
MSHSITVTAETPPSPPSEPPPSLSEQPVVKIDPVFEKLLDTLTPEEFAGLEADIVKHGCLAPLICWKNVLLDGHNRRRICLEHDFPYQVENIDLPDRHAAYNWIIDHQLSRRNVTPERASYLRGKRYNQEKQDQGGDRKSKAQNAPLIGNTAERLGEHFGVDAATVKRDGQFAEAIDALPEDVQAPILSGEAKVTKTQVLKIAKVEDPVERATIARAAVTKPRSRSKPASATAKPKRSEIVKSIFVFAQKARQMLDEPEVNIPELKRIMDTLLDKLAYKFPR